jgi:hypothetical protein
MIAKGITIICLLVARAICADAQKVIKVDSTHCETLHIDPSNASGGNVADVFEKLNYIPLETTPESLFGRISQLEIVDNYYIILDESTGCIVIFNKDGKYHAKIKCKGKSTPYKFYVNRWTKQIVYSNDYYSTLIYCDFDGKQIKTEDEMVKDNNPMSFKFIGPTKLVSRDMYRDNDATSKDFKPYTRSLLQYQDGKKIYAMAFNYTEAKGKKESTHKGDQLSYFGSDTTLFYSEYFNYRVNTITPNTITRTYQFVFPLSMTLPSDFNTNAAYDVGLNDYLNSHKELIYCINNFYKGGNNLLFEASNRDYNSKNRSLIYNLKSGTLVSFEHITPDDMSFFLPIYGGDFDNQGIQAFDGEYAYTSIPSITMFKANDDNKDKKVKYNPVLADYFSKGTKRDNPVIVQFKVKDNL